MAILAVFAYHFLGYWRTGAGVRPPAGVAGGVPREILLYGGMWGVSVFVVLSGVGLAAAMTKAPSIGAFYRRRLLRVFPLFWWIAVPALLVLLIAGRLSPGLLWQAPFWLTGTTILWPGHLWPVCAAWWFITLIVQIYLVFPFLWRLAQRVGPATVVLLSLPVTALCLRWVEHLGASGGADASRYIGLAFVGCRLTEVTVGLCLGALYWRWTAGERPSPRALAAAAGAIPGAYLLLRPFDRFAAVQAAAVLFVAVMLSAPVRRLCTTRALRPLLWLGVTSYAFYAVHTLVIAPSLSIADRVGMSSQAAALAVSLGIALAATAAFYHSYAALAPRLVGAAQYAARTISTSQPSSGSAALLVMSQRFSSTTMVRPLRGK